MKQNLRKLNLISRFIPIDMFYSVTIWENEISLQGKFNPTLNKALIKLHFNSCVVVNGFLTFTRSNITITLT